MKQYNSNQMKKNTDKDTAKIMNKLARHYSRTAGPKASLKYRSSQHIYLIY